MHQGKYIVFTWIFKHEILFTNTDFYYIYLGACWSKETPPPGGVSYLLFSLIKNRVWEETPRRICTKFFKGGPLTHGSWWGNIVNRKPPRSGGFLSINVYKYIILCENLCFNVKIYVFMSQYLFLKHRFSHQNLYLYECVFMYKSFADMRHI